MKLIITHISPDFDALTSVWLIKRFWPDFKDAQIKLVPAGTTYLNEPADIDKNIIHVDTGNGRFDHHQTNEYTCSAIKVYQFLKTKGYIKYKYLEPLNRITCLVNEIDHFHEIFYQDSDKDIFDLTIDKIIESLKSISANEQHLYITVFNLIDCLLYHFVSKISAEKDIKNAYVFKSSWGKTIAIKSNNGLVAKLSQRLGYDLVIQKYPATGYVKIKSRPDNKKLLKRIYEIVKISNSKATWYYHVSGHMILNGVMSNPKRVASELSINQLINIVRSVNK